ncbi:MAG TPA: ABC transporter permease [Firmicutes bacterium]|nr:ABC transporter permease [Bacillota bacterium]
MILRVLRAERIKYRRAPVWLAVVILPLFPAVLGTANYLANLEVLQQQWYSLWTQHTLFASYFFLPALLAVFCAWQWRLEYAQHNFNSLLAAPVSHWAVYLSKLLPAVGMSFLAQLVTGLLFLAGGAAAGIDAPVPPQLAEWLLCGGLGGMAVCAVQLFLSLLLPSFAIPVAIALVGGIAGLMVTAQGLGLWFPYSLLSLGMRANDPTMELNVAVLLLSSVGYTCLFALLTVLLLKKRDSGGEP